MKEKCQFCEFDRGPIVGRLDICDECCDCDKFQVKKRMHPIESFKYEQLKKEEEWVNDRSVEYDRDTALAVLKALSANMYASHDLFGEPTLVINRYRFEAVRKKFLDKKED